MKRTEVLQEVRLMRFEEAYEYQLPIPSRSFFLILAQALFSLRLLMMSF